MTGPLESSQSYYGNPRLALPQFIHPASKRKIDAIAQSGPELKHLKFNSHHQTVKSDPHKKLEERLTAIESALGFDDQSSNNIQKMQEALREAHKMLATICEQLQSLANEGSSHLEPSLASKPSPTTEPNFFDLCQLPELNDGYP